MFIWAVRKEEEKKRWRKCDLDESQSSATSVWRFGNNVGWTILRTGKQAKNRWASPKEIFKSETNPAYILSLAHASGLGRAKMC